MAKRHPYIQTAIVSAIIFFALIFLVVFTALYVKSVNTEPEVSRAAVEQNLTPPGKLYPSQ